MTDHIVEAPKKVLSPTAMAVLDAFLNGCICNSADNSVAFQADRNGLAAALRVFADQIAPTEQNYEEAPHKLATVFLNGVAYAVNEMRLIATELEGQP